MCPYLGLVDTGCSASLIDQSLVEGSSYDIKLHMGTSWEAQAGTFQTDGVVKIE
jgi:hypothetical protein